MQFLKKLVAGVVTQRTVRGSFFIEFGAGVLTQLGSERLFSKKVSQELLHRGSERQFFVKIATEFVRRH